MKKWGGGLLVVCAIGLSTACNDTASRPFVDAPVPNSNKPDIAQSKRDVESLLKAQAEDWSAGKLEDFCAVYADDALFVSPKGLTRGRDEILARYDKRYRQGGAEMGKLRLDVVETRTTGDAASAALKWHLTFSDGKTTEGHSLVTLRRGGQGWQIVQDASM